MEVKGLLFDVNGTLIDIHTDESRGRIFRSISTFLSYHGVFVDRRHLRDEYFHIQREQRHCRGEEHPEFDAVAVWRELLRRRGAYGNLPGVDPEQMARFLAVTFRGVSRRRLELYPGVREVLDGLRGRFRLAAVTDGQSAWALPEMRAAGLNHYFDPVVVSGDHGFRKPDRRLFEMALGRLGLAPWEVLFVGNDMYRDVFGPKRLGMKTVFFSSNQGRKHMDGVDPDYIIYDFRELPRAVEFLAQTH